MDATNMEHEYQEHSVADNREGFCPTCGGQTAFIFLGVQRWPARLVELTGCPAETILFTCAGCKTTVSETDIE
ncbi:MAG: hypothetical protein ABI690_08960 [Chloroflexota bacterium]